MRLTTDNPKDNMESARNLFYIKDGETWVRGGGPEPDYEDVPLYDWVRRIIETHGLEIDVSDNDILGDCLYERLFDCIDTVEGVVAHLYTAAWAFAELREKLKAYEDTGLEPEEIISGEELAEIASTLLQLLQYQALGTVEELSAWKQAVDLVGKSYYTVYDGEDEASIGAIDAVEFREDGIFLMDNGEISRLDEVGQNVDGKTVFLTCVEAEAALSAKEGDDHETDPV